MKLKDIDHCLLQKAINIYLHLAYEGMDIPSNVRLKSQFNDPNNTDSWTDDHRFENERGLGSNRFFLRLGNKIYPHMKLGIVECAGMIGEFLFMVDTHDRHFDLVSNLPDLDEFKELQVENGNLKEKIELAWRENGIPTEVAIVSHQKVGDSRKKNSYSILIVDDTDSMLLLERKAFEKAGFNVHTSVSGEDALDLVRSQTIDLCVLDVMMPVMNGYDVIEQLEKEGLRDFPIILCTAAYEGKVRKELADDYVAKPFSPIYLVKKAEALLNIH